MGWQDRDYYRESTWSIRRIDWSPYLPPRGCVALIVLHIAAFVLLAVAASDEGLAWRARITLVSENLTAWALLLHPFSTSSIFTLIFVAFAIGWLGGRVEREAGTRRLIVLYVLGTLAGGLAFCGLGLLLPVLTLHPLDLPLGAIVAWGAHVSRREAFEVVGVFDKLVRLPKLLAILGGIWAALVLLRAGPAALGWFVAAAGGAAAFFAVELTPAWWRRLGRPAGGAVRAAPPRIGRIEREPVRPHEPEAPDIDDILAKISRSGLDSLTDEERERLEAARRAKLRASGRSRPS